MKCVLLEECGGARNYVGHYHSRKRLAQVHSVEFGAGGAVATTSVLFDCPARDMSSEVLRTTLKSASVSRVGSACLL